MQQQHSLFGPSSLHCARPQVYISAHHFLSISTDNLLVCTVHLLLHLISSLYLLCLYTLMHVLQLGPNGDDGISNCTN